MRAPGRWKAKFSRTFLLPSTPRNEVSIALKGTTARPSAASPKPALPQLVRSSTVSTKSPQRSYTSNENCAARGGVFALSAWRSGSVARSWAWQRACANTIGCQQRKYTETRARDLDVGAHQGTPICLEPDALAYNYLEFSYRTLKPVLFCFLGKLGGFVVLDDSGLS